MPNQAPPEVKQERRRRLESLERELRQAYFQSLTGRSLRVMAESFENGEPASGRLVGTSCRYAPVAFPAGSVRPGELVDVLARRAAPQRIEGDLAT
jgi:tRNA A37 methylthiotransferase MiaB